MTVSDLRRRCRRLELVSPLPALLLVLALLALLIDLSGSEWAFFTGCLFAHVVVAGFWAERHHRRFLAPVFAYLGEDSAEERIGSIRERRVAAAFRAVLGLPVRMQSVGFLASLLPALWLPVAMTLMGSGGWLDPARLWTVFLACFVGALTTATIVFYRAKQEFAGFCSELAEEIGDPAKRAELVPRYSLVRKLQFAVIVPVLATVLLVDDVVSERARREAEDAAVAWTELALDTIARADSSLALEARRRTALPAEEFWPLPLGLAEIEPGRVELESDARISRSFVAALEERVGQGESAGVVRNADEPVVGAFQRLEDGRVLVAVVERAHLRSANLAWNGAVALLCAIMTLFAAAIAHLVGTDLRDGLASLRVEAERMASGDLRQLRVFDSEDELGDLGRAFQAMGSSLRSTVERVSRATDRVEHTASDIAAVARSVGTASSDQFERIRRASELMVSINQQVREVSHSAQTLNESIDESSSSVLELGATGDELSETASLLSTKVDEVSGSIEQMVRSVNQVSATTEQLASASEETSSSMEEMASAMRVVDTSAETTARLSRDVVQKAEIGQAKVSQTIEGMEAIRDATDAAESVIRGLGDRTKEIGGILDVIDDVADETNLLALNAAIIAAQAGEQGRAFSVVAEEIKELADRVLASTKEIGGLIRSVQAESGNAVGAIEAGSESVMSGVDLSAEAGRTLEEITDASRESGQRIAEIVSSVREQTKAASHVVELMERVRESAEAIGAAGSEQDRGNEVVYRSTLTMREVAQQVHRTTEEQSRGFGRIRESVEGVREAVEQINASLREQSDACGHVAEFLEQVFDGTKSNEFAAEKMGEAMQGLLSQAETLREDVGRFRVS